MNAGIGCRDPAGKTMPIQPAEFLPEGSATAREINYSLGRWGALTRYLDDGHLPIDNDWAENQIRPIAIRRNNWLLPAACARTSGSQPS